MKVGVYAIENVLSGSHSGLYLYRSDLVAARNLYSLAIRTNPDFDISELRLKKVGIFDDETCEYECINPVIIGWNPRGRVEPRSEPVPVEKAEADFESMNS